MSELGTYHGESTIMRKTLDWNRSKISMALYSWVPTGFETKNISGGQKKINALLCVVKYQLNR
jgi:hypothetical protein